MRTLRSTAMLLALLILHGRPVAISGFDPDEQPERSFFEHRGVAPPNARQRAFEQMLQWHASHDDLSANSHIWKSIGPLPARDHGVGQTGRVTAILLSPIDRNLIVVGTSGGGIWRSTDGGTRFVPVSDDQADINVGAMAIAPSNPEVMYAAMGEDHLGSGVLKSIDSGATWRRVTTDFPAGSSASRIVVDPNDENVVWMVQRLVVDSSGVLKATLALLKSMDGGVTWRSMFDGAMHECLIASADGKTVVIGTARRSRPGTGGIYRTTDGGETWTLVYLQGQPEVPPHYYLAADRGGTLYGVAVDSVNDHIRRQVIVSSDGGEHWTKRADAPRDVRIMFLASSPHDSTLYLGGIGAYRSSDGGLTWNSIATHLDQHAIAFDASDPARVWLGNDGGLFRSADNGMTFESLADRLPVMEFYRVNAHPTDRSVLLGGTQDNGLQRQDDDREWTELFEGDFGTQLFDVATSRILTSTIGASIARITSNGSIEPVVNSTTFGDTRRVVFIAPLVQGPDGTVWFATHRIFASKDFGTTWTAPAGDLDLTTGDRGTNLDAVSAIGVSQSDGRVLYTGSAQGRVMVSNDAGVTWKDITPSPRAYVASIAVDFTAPGSAWVAYAAYNARVLKTTDFGTTWTDAGSGLPELPVNVLYINPRDSRTMYAGTDIGIFRSDRGGEQWEPFNNGMPPVVVTSFTTTADGRLIAGTYGRGVYQLTSTEPPLPRRRAVPH